MPQLLWFHVVHMSNGQAVQGLADVLNVITLYIPHHHDLCFGLHIHSGACAESEHWEPCMQG